MKKRNAAAPSGLLRIVVGILVLCAFQVVVVVFFRFPCSSSAPSSVLLSNPTTASASTSSSNNNDVCGSSHHQRFAFVWYLSNPSGYPCSILASIIKLRNDLELPSCIETALVYNPNAIPNDLVQRLRETKLIDSFYAFEDIPTTQNETQYYKGVLTKLSIFRLSNYDRILFLDGDAYPLKPLHSLLLNLPKAAPIDFWAVRPYWLPNQKICSALMVLQPNPQFYNQQLQEIYFRDGISAPQTYDMDILEHALGAQAGLLPDSMLELDAFFEKPSLLLAKTNRTRNGRLADASLFHFSNFKPWGENLRRVFQHPSLVPVKDIILEWREKVQPWCPNYIDMGGNER